MNNDTIPRGLFFLAGAATGLAIGIYLNSEKGSALREQLEEHWETLVQTIGEGAREKMDELLATLNEVLEKGMILLDNVTDYLEEDISDEEAGEFGEEVSEIVDEVGYYFGSGMAKARARLQQQFAKSGL